MALEGNGRSSNSNRVNTNAKVNLNESWTIAFWVDGLVLPKINYLFSSIGWNGFGCSTNGTAGSGNIILRQSNGGIRLIMEGVVDTAKHEIIFVHDRNNKMLKAYKDGKYHTAASYTDSLVGNIWDRDAFVIAGYGSSNSINSGALIDEFMIYSYAIDTTKLGTLSFEGTTYTYDVSGCGNSAIAADGTKFTKSGTFYDTLFGTGIECDTIITYNVTLFPSYSDTQSINACGYYVALSGDTLRNSQMYNDTFTNINGCDSIVTMDVTIISYDPGVTRNGNDLSANQDNASYAWLDCDAGYSPITDATGQTFTPTINGNFALELTYKSCVDTSDCISVSNLSFHAFGSSSIKIQPNPNEGVFVLTSELPSLGQVRIVNANGQVVLEKDANSQSELKLDIKEFPAGIYFIEVKGQNSLDRLKVIKNN